MLYKFIALVCFLFSASVNAFFCQFAEGTKAINVTLPLQGGDITVGPDTPNGTIVFRQYYKPAYPPTIWCDAAPSALSVYYDYSYTSNPYPLSTSTAGVFAGKVYQTNIPGIGVVAWYSGNAFPYRRLTYNIAAGYAYVRQEMPEFDISLVKTGDISPGRVLGSALPSVAIKFLIPGQSEIMMVNANFSGQLNVLSQTCTTPDVYVPMGTYKLSESFTGVGSVTDWKNASVVLRDCPRFYGTLDSDQSNWASDDGTASAGNFKQNTIKLQLTPNTELIDAVNGIIGVKKHSGSASGVGVQLAKGNVGDTSPALVNINQVSTYTMPNGENTTWRVPLLARYIQTADSVTPGRADASVTFTVSYY